MLCLHIILTYLKEDGSGNSKMFTFFFNVKSLHTLVFGINDIIELYLEYKLGLKVNGKSDVSSTLKTLKIYRMDGWTDACMER